MVINKNVNNTKDLSEALDKCKAYAKRGNALAKDAISLLKKVVFDVSDSLQSEINTLQASNFNDNATTNNLVTQLSDIRFNFEFLPLRLSEDVKALSKTTFSITLFGRTMAGKSTLMEILTHGNGKSIGNGSQRITRDVRTYPYRELKITDVLGVAAFEGKDDENIAFEAAKKCDLILFLITTAPQAEEAECLNRILELGKPVICLVNIKQGIDKETIQCPKKFGFFKKNIQKKFDNGQKELNEIKKQFLAFGTQYGQDWNNIRFA
jgi:tRNA U34 5-carboxymethylaminomethyl modifying GTPase MnmE/TrmE